MRDRSLRRQERTPAAQIAIGLFVICIGMLFLVDNLGWMDLDFRIHLWPSALIFFGVLKVLQTRSPSGLLVGGGLILVGGLLLLKAMGIITLGWHALWPVLLIAFGLSVVFKSVNHNRGNRVANVDGDPVTLDKDGDDRIVNITALAGGFTRRLTTPDFRGGEITALMGGCDLDLRQSSIAPGSEAVLNVFAMFGGITIKVPIDWTVVLQGTPIMGGFEEKTVPPADQAKRLVIRGYAIMGGVEVRN